MDKKIKTLIADKKLNDEFILKALEAALTTADAADADENSDGDTQEEQQQEEEESQITSEESDDVEEDATPEQPDIDAIVQAAVAKALADMKGGKKPPVPKKVVKVKKEVDITREFGAL